jgi:mutator protein MutT
MNSPVEVGVALIRENGRFLVAKRLAGGHLGGLWEFPGGKREAGESFEACLMRELREELAVEIEVEEPFRIVRHAYPEKTVELHFYLCRIVNGEPCAVGCENFQWVTPRELPALEFPPADRELVLDLASGKGKGAE